MIAALALLLALAAGPAQPRARDLGIPFEGTPGPLNSITDIAGVEVGQKTLIEGEGALKVGIGPVRTGVTIIFPRGHLDRRPVYGGFFDLNGNGEMTGRAYLEDFGVVQGPIGISDTNAIGEVYQSIQQWSAKKFGEATWPVVAETWSGYLNDIEGFHVTGETAAAALDDARPGAVEEGNVGGGTGMVCFGFKGGIGTASRVVSLGGQRYTLGVLVQCNTGDRKVLRIAGVPVGEEVSKRWLPCFDPKLGRGAGDLKPCTAAGTQGEAPPDQGSIIIVVGTDAPLMPLQLNRLAKRAAMGLARLGSYSGNSSGDLILSFSTAPGEVNHEDQDKPSPITPVANGAIDLLFKAAAEASEEAIVNALVAARTMTGINGTRIFAIPHDELRNILKRYNRLEDRK
ncbi:MAG TPA: P1 family peptidase [Sphingomicrobium sp.]|nr:P1 family peptidase [Sphingomicrobium sp.]